MAAMSHSEYGKMANAYTQNEDDEKKKKKKKIDPDAIRRRLQKGSY